MPPLEQRHGTAPRGSTRRRHPKRDRLKVDPLFQAAEAATQSVRRSQAQDQPDAATQPPVEAIGPAHDGIDTMPLYRKRAPGMLFNGMIQPLSELHLRGVAWYQGAANLCDDRGLP